MLLLPEHLPTSTNVVHNYDALRFLQLLPDNFVHCIVTSPPYFGLRNYGIAGQIGLEETPREFVNKLVMLFREARRVLRDDGVVWVNMGDSYSGSGRGPGGVSGIVPSQTTRQGFTGTDRTIHEGFKAKDLMMIPARLAIALQEDGWYLRSEIVWSKPNPMPESVTDRPTKSHEMVYLLAKSERYFYDKVAISEPVKSDTVERNQRGNSNHHKNLAVPGRSSHSMHQARANGTEYVMPPTRNKRSVWTVPVGGFKGAHFAVFPEKLITPMILAGCPETVCAVCGAPHERVVGRGEILSVGGSDNPERARANLANHSRQSGDTYNSQYTNRMIQRRHEHLGWKPTCDCDAGTVPGIVLDMFGGSGTVGVVALKHNRRYILNDLNREYVNIANERLNQVKDELARQQLPENGKLRHPSQPRKAKPLTDLPLFAFKPEPAPVGIPAYEDD